MAQPPRQMQGDRSALASARLATLARHFLRHSSPPPPISGSTRIDPTRHQTEIRRANGPNIAVTVRAALLVCLFEGDAGDLRVILIKRASTMSSHAGEIALPGGKRDEGDANDVETALREAREEIGLDPSLVNVVTVLEPFISVRGISVVPVVGILADRKAFQPVPNPGEVELVLDAPLEMFLKDKNRRANEMEVMGHKCLLHFFDYETQDGEKYVIFALCAGILIKTASFSYQRQPDFAVRSPKFWH